MQLLYEEKKKAYMYVLVSGFYKVRLAQFLSISRPTLDRMLHDDPHFFTQLQAADAEFCKKLIMQVAKKNPTFILKTKYRTEFPDNSTISIKDSRDDIGKMKQYIDEQIKNDQK